MTRGYLWLSAVDEVEVGGSGFLSLQVWSSDDHRGRGRCSTSGANKAEGGRRGVPTRWQSCKAVPEPGKATARAAIACPGLKRGAAGLLPHADPA